jgi:hypothetical protein
MRFSEVFLRLGSTLVAWMVLFTHVIWLAALGGMGCGPDGDELHFVLLWLTPFTIGFSLLLHKTRPFPEIDRILRWLGVPWVGLAIAGIYKNWESTTTVYSSGRGICGDADLVSWHMLWGPVQLLGLAIAAVMVLRLWRSAPAQTR